MATVIGIDLGAHSVKLAVMEGRLGRVELKEYCERAVPQDAENPPTLDRRLAAAGALIEDLELPPDTAWCAAYPTEAASARIVTLPFTDRGKISETLPFEIEGYVPFDLEDFVLDYRVLDARDNRSRVMAVLAEKDRLGALISGMGELGADPRHMVLDAEILAALTEGDQPRLILDLGHSRTLATFISGGQVVSSRAISFGGRDLTAALASRFGLAWQVAEQLKHQASLGDGTAAPVLEWEDDEDTQIRDQAEPGALPSHDQVTAELIRSLAALRAGLRATLLAADEEMGAELEEVLICGGGAHLEGLGRWLADDLGLPVRRLWVSDGAEDMAASGRFALSQGLASRAAGVTSGRELDFRKGEYAFRGDLARLRALAGAGGIALTVFMMAAVVLFSVRFVQLNQELADQEDAIVAAVRDHFPEVSDEKLRTPGMPKAIMVEKTAEAIERVEVLGGTVGNDPPTLAMMKEISNHLPKPDEARISVEQLTITTDAVSIKALTTSYESAATIEKSLQGSETLASARKSDEKKKRDQISFVVTVPLDDEIEEEG